MQQLEENKNRDYLSYIVDSAFEIIEEKKIVKDHVQKWERYRRQGAYRQNKAITV